MGYDHISKANFDKGIEDLENDSFTMDGNIHVKSIPASGISEATVYGGSSTDLGISARDYVAAMALIKEDSDKINNDLFKQVFPEVKGREAIKLTAKWFADDISGSLTSSLKQL